MDTLRYSAGVWEQGRSLDGFCEWSRHRTEAAAQNAARKYARRHRAQVPTGGALSWSGGWREDDGPVEWVNA